MTGNKNHNEIAHALRCVGDSVQDTSGVAGFVDLIASRGKDRTVIIEIKRPDRGRITAATLHTLAMWRGHAAIIATIDQALAVMAAPTKHCLNERERSNLLVLARAMTAKGQKEMTWNAFQKAMGDNK